MKGILKKDSGRQQSGNASLHWDEDNISTTEQEKAAFSSIKISEPKTPFIHYKMETDEILGSSLSNGGNEVSRLYRSAPHACVDEIPELPRNKPSAMRSVAAAAVQADELTRPARRLSVSLHHNPGHAEGHGWESSEDDLGPHAPHAQVEQNSHGEAGPAHTPEYVHEHFEELRAKHYRMKEAIKEARSLLREEGLPDLERESKHD